MGSLINNQIFKNIQIKKTFPRTENLNIKTIIHDKLENFENGKEIEIK